MVHLLDTTTLTVARIDQIEPYTLLDWSPDNRSLVYVKTAESSFMIRSHIGVIPSQSLELAMSNGSLPVQSFYLRLRMPVALHSSSACGAMVKIGDKSHGIRMGRSITFGYPGRCLRTVYIPWCKHLHNFNCRFGNRNRLYAGRRTARQKLFSVMVTGFPEHRLQRNRL